MLRILLLLLPLLAHAGEHTMDHPPLKTWLPETPPRAVILALHSFGDYSAAFDHVGPWFAQRGYALYAWDQRGFGAHDNAGEQASYRFYPHGPHLLLQGSQWEQVLTDSLNWLEQSRATRAPAELIYSGAH